MIVVYVKGQCVNGVETNPINPQNNSLPQNNNLPDTRFLNGFSWMLDQNNYNIPLNDMGMNPGEYYGNMEPINSDAYLNYYYYLNENYQEVMLPENGWEIISDNRGFYPDNTSSVDWQQNLTLRKIPYILFYNKYSGIARFFVRYGNNEVPAHTINAVELTISHQDRDKMSGLLRLGGALDRALDKNSITHRITTKVPNPGGAELWFSGDFQMAYDPCICNYSSQISLDFNFITSAKIDLHGRSIFTTSPIVNSTGAVDNEFLSGISNDNESGFIIYEHMASLVEDYEKKLKEYQQKLISVNRYNAQIDKYLQIMGIAKSLFTLGPAAAALLDPTFKITEFSKELSKALAAGFDLIVKEDFKKKSLPQSPSMPTVSYGEMKFNGTIEYDVYISGPTINTPGSNGANQINLNKPTQYPTYNEILGQFALIETPKLEVYEGVNTECFIYDHQPINIINQGYLQAYDLPLMQFTKEYVNQVRLKEDLKYAFNPILPIKDYTMDIGLEVRRKISYPSTSTMPLSLYGIDFNQNIKHFHEPKFTANFNSIDVNIDEIEEYKLNESIILTPFMLNSNAVKSICYAFGHKTVYKNPGINYNDNILHSSQVGYLNNSVYGNCNQMNESLVYEEPYEYYVKVQLNVTYQVENTSGDPIEFNYLFTYKIEKEDMTFSTEPFYNEVVGTSLDINQFPENLVINGVNFDGSQVEGCKLVNNSYNCQAWNNVTIHGDNTVSSGYQVFVKAGNEIEMLPETNITPEMELSIVPVLDFSDPMQEMDISEVNTFCVSNKYKAREGSKNMLIDSNDLVVSPNSLVEIKNPFSFSLFPNPTSNQVAVRFNQAFEGASISVTDVFGKEMLVRTQKTDQGFELSLEEFAVGVYLVTVNTPEGSITKQLVKK